jgi:cbb3-type cytochrome oxidase cytochrome c subunit
MGLLGGVARTAAVAGTATVVSNRVSRRQANKAAEHDAQNAQQQQPAPASSAMDDTDAQMAQLQKLGQLHDQGVLTDEEFTAKKQQILGL